MVCQRVRSCINGMALWIRDILTFMFNIWYHLEWFSYNCISQVRFGEESFSFVHMCVYVEMIFYEDLGIIF